MPGKDRPLLSHGRGHRFNPCHTHQAFQWVSLVKKISNCFVAHSGHRHSKTAAFRQAANATWRLPS